MMVMTAKIDIKKILLGLAIAVALIVALVTLFRGGDQTAPTAASGVSNNDGRVQFLKDLGWDVTTTPTESGEVKIPAETSEVFDRYNSLQKSQGYDLTTYAGKLVMRYVYQVNNYPGATEPVYATLLIYKNQVIGGDVTDTSAKGVVRGLQMAPDNSQTTPTPVPETTE
jgi:hypothetical protein